MEKILRFKNENEKKGAELIIDNVILRSRLIKSYSKSYPSEVSIRYENVPDIIFNKAMNNPDWPLIDLVGRSEKLQEIVLGIEKRFDEAEDKVSEAKLIIAEIQRLIDVQI